MSPPANRVQVVAGSNAVAGSAAGRLASSGQAERSRTRSTPNRLSFPQARARTDGPTSSARRKARRFLFLARSALRARGVCRFDQPRRVRGPFHPERRQDRVGLARRRVRARRSACSCRPARPRPRSGSSSGPVTGSWSTGTIGTSARTTPGVGEAVGWRRGRGGVGRGRRDAGCRRRRSRTARRRPSTVRRRLRSRTRARRPRRARPARSRGGRGRREGERVSRAGV